MSSMSYDIEVGEVVRSESANMQMATKAVKGLPEFTADAANVAIIRVYFFT